MKLRNLYEDVLKEYLYHGSKRNEINWDNRNEQVDYNMLGFGIYLTNNKSEALGYSNRTDSTEKYVHIFKPINANIINWSGPIPKHIIENIKNNSNLYPIKGDFDFEDMGVKVKGGSLDWDYLEEPLPQWVIDDNGQSGYFIIKYDKNHNEIGDTLYGLSKDNVIDVLNNEHVMGVIDIDTSDFYGILDVKEGLDSKNIFNSFAHLYAYIYKSFKSTRKATKFFVKLGIDGVVFNDMTSDFDNMSDADTQTTVIYNPNKFKLVKTMKIN